MKVLGTYYIKTWYQRCQIATEAEVTSVRTWVKHILQDPAWSEHVQRKLQGELYWSDIIDAIYRENNQHLFHHAEIFKPGWKFERIWLNEANFFTISYDASLGLEGITSVFPDITLISTYPRS